MSIFLQETRPVDAVPVNLESMNSSTLSEATQGQEARRNAAQADEMNAVTDSNVHNRVHISVIDTGELSSFFSPRKAQEVEDVAC